MAAKEETRIFVGGLSWDTTERRLEDAFSRYGNVIETQLLCYCKLLMIMVERDTGRPRGFGFVTFTDRRAVEDAIHEMHGREFDGRVISVNKAEPKVATYASGYGGGGYSGDRGGDRGMFKRGGSDRPPPLGQTDCFKCGRPGHWARECPSSDGGRISSRPRFSGSVGSAGRGDRFGVSDRFGGSERYVERVGEADRYAERYVDDQYEGGRYRERDHVDSRDSRYSGGRDRYGSDRISTGGDRFSGDRYGGSDRQPQNGFAKEGGYARAAGPRGGGDRYGSGGPARHEGVYRERAVPYERPSRGRHSSYDRI